MEAPDNLFFEDFELDRLQAELRKDGSSVRIEPQVFDLLWYFGTNAGKLVSKDDLIEGIWKGRIVSDAAISTRINGARVAIGDNGSEQRLIRTVPRRGFRFLADVRNPDAALPDDNHNTPDQKTIILGTQEAQKPAIAIMPIQVIDGTQDTFALAEGMRIDIQNALIKVSGLFLTAVGSVNAAKDMGPLEAAKALDARYLLTGQLRQSKDRLRLSVQLLDAKTNQIVLSDQFDHQFEDIFKVLDEVAAEVLQTLNVALVAGEPARVWHKTLRDIDSLSIFYRGISNFFKMNREAISFARGDFEKIARWHPDLAIGSTWVALTHWFDLQRGWSPDKKISRKKARQSAEKAAELPDSDGQAHTVLSHIYLLDGDFSAALQAGSDAVANRPSCSNANAFYANVLHYCGQDADALNHIRLALHQSPFSPTFFKLILIRSLIAQQQFDVAQNVLESILQPENWDVPTLVLACLLATRQQDHDLAEIHAEQIRKLEPRFTISWYLEREPYQNEESKKSLALDLAECGLPR